MSRQSKTVSREDKVDFFLPVFSAYLEKLTQALSQSHHKNYSDAEWILIFENKRMGKLLSNHMLLEAWDDFEDFLKKEVKLLAFIEEKASGLVEKTYKFWTFFSPDHAIAFFKNQVDQPKNFSSKSIIPLPFVKLVEPLIEILKRNLKDDKISIIKKIEKSRMVMEMGQEFLKEDELSRFDDNFKRLISGITRSETRTLLNEIRSTGTSPVLLEKRLQGIFDIGWRYFRAKNAIENEYFRKLLSEEDSEREKGLKLTLKKVSDYLEESSG